jgi:hypothetical protein
MTVQNTNRKDVYLTNGTTIYWPYTFEIFTTDGSDLVLYETNLTTGETILIDTNLTRDIINSRIKYPQTGSPRPAGYKITVARVTERTQGASLQTQTFDPKNMERGLDKLTAIVQEIDETVSRAAVADISQQGASFTFPSPVGGKVVGWNAEGTGLINLDNTTLGIEAQMLAATEAAEAATDAAEAALQAVEENAAALNNGWNHIADTCTFVSAEDPVFVLNITGDYTHLTPGNRFRCTQVTGGQKDFIIHAVGSFTNGVTPITIFGGTGVNSTVLNDEAITNVYFSMMNFPSGFDTDPTRWQILILDSTDYIFSNVDAETWVNPGAPNMQIDVPIGTWTLGYDVHAKADRVSAGSSASVYATLSTENNNASNPSLITGTWLAQISDPPGGDHILTQSLAKSIILSVTSKTRYYLNLKSEVSSHLTIKGAAGTTAIYARSYFF